MTDPNLSLAASLNTPLRQWWDIFFDLVSLADEAATGEIADAEGGRLSQFTQARLSRLRKKRDDLRRKVRTQIGGWMADTSVGTLKVGGVVARVVNGGPVPVYLTPAKPRILLSNGSAGGTIEVVPPEADVVANFLVWFWNVGPAMGNHDPRQVIRQSLAASGITKENYRTHPSSPGYNGRDLIAYPWDD